MASFYPKISFHGKEGGWCLVDLLKNIEMAEPEYIMNDMCFIFFNEVRPYASMKTHERRRLVSLSTRRKRRYIMLSSLLQVATIVNLGYAT